MDNDRVCHERDAPSSGEGCRVDRRQAFLDAAESLFLEQGFDRSSLAAIVKRSGGSLATLYELFGNKQGLLREVIERGRQQRFGTLQTVIEEMNSEAEILRLIARSLRDYLMSPHAIAMIRIVISESLRDPEFGRYFHAERSRQLAELAELFASWNARGKAAIDDPAAAAELFHAMMTSDAQLNALIGSEPHCRELAEGQMDWRLNLFIQHFRIHGG